MGLAQPRQPIAARYRPTSQSGGTTPPGYVLDPQLWMCSEGLDLSLRARLRGHRTVLRAHRERPAQAQRHRRRNARLLLCRAQPDICDRKGPPLARHPAPLARHAHGTNTHGYRGVARHSRRCCSARLRGMLVGLLTWPRVLPARRRVLSTTLVSPSHFEKTLRKCSIRQRKAPRDV